MELQTTSQTCRYKAVKFLGKGNTSLIYEVAREGEEDQRKRYALKRYFLKNSMFIKRLLNERKLLERVSMQSNFLPTLYSATWLNTSAIMVMTAGCGVDLYYVLESHHPLNIAHAKFYAAEILCGLEHLHNLKILHLDLKPENIPIKSNGHIMLVDFDHALDFSSGPRCHPERCAGTVDYMSPEAANLQVLDEKADIWSWASVLVELIDDCVRDCRIPECVLFSMARRGVVDIKSFEDFSEGLKQLLRSCFQRNPRLRPSIEQIKASEFFNDINWEDVAACRLPPPIQMTSYEIRSLSIRSEFNPHNPKILDNLKETEMLDLGSIKRNPDGSYRCGYFIQDSEELLRNGLTPDKVSELFSDFNFRRLENMSGN